MSNEWNDDQTNNHYNNRRSGRQGSNSYNPNSTYGDRSNYGGRQNRPSDRRSWRDPNSSYTSNTYNSNNSSKAKEVLKNFQKDFSAEFIKKEEISKEDLQKYYQKHKMVIKNSDVLPILRFNQFNFSQNISDYFTQMNFQEPTPIQAQGWSMALTGRDMVGIAQTGSGKSLSFIVPALIHLSENRKKGINSHVLVLAPTRELCLQITEVAKNFSSRFDIQTVAIYGGVAKYGQINALNRGASFICACPGRLKDLIETGYVPINQVSFLVLDEADRMLDMGFEPELRSIASKLPLDRQTLMWSATWPAEVRELANSYMTDYATVTIGGEDLNSSKNVEQKIIILDERNKFDELMKILSEKEKTIIFCNKKRSCDELEFRLRQTRHPNVYCSAIHGDKSQQMRDTVISDFKSGRTNVLIATDVAARGLDVRDVKRVVNYDMSQNCEQYVHRIGRTGRGTDKGTSFTFFTHEDRGTAKGLINILRKNDQFIPRDLEDFAYDNSRSSNSMSQKRRRWR